MVSPAGGRERARGGGGRKGRKEGERKGRIDEERKREERVDTNVSLSGCSVRVFAVCTSRLGRGIKFRSISS